MARSLVEPNAMAVIKRWRQLLVQGAKQELDQFLEDVEKRFGTLGWKRDLVFEGKLNCDPEQLDRFYCWMNEPGNRLHTTLCLKRATDRRVRGGTYDFQNQQGSIVDLASEIRRIMAEVLEPAAAANGLKVNYPQLGPISRFGFRTETAMNALDEVSAGQWPLADAAEPVWRKFVVTAVHDDVALHADELTAWFVASGWGEEASIELANRFYADAARLEEYENERPTA